MTIIRQDTSLAGTGASRIAKKIKYGRRLKIGEAPSGIFTGVVTDDADPQNMGRIKVYIEGFSTPSFKISSPPAASHSRYALTFSPVFPFAGSDDNENKDGFSQSYGMWYQPRAGDHVIVAFANSSVADGYYLGCIQKYSQTFQTPGAAINNVTGEDNKLPSTEVPKGEAPGSAKISSVLAENLKASGLIKDPIRGGGDASQQRESPSQLLGIKTRGHSDLGMIGHQFIMDDLPESQGVRLRTSTGNQVLLSDAANSIYISTSKADTWMELTADGNIYLYGSKSLSIHAEEDVNITAGRDLNLDVGRDLNAIVASNVNAEIGDDLNALVKGRAYVQSENEIDVTAGNHIKLESGDGGIHNFTSGDVRFSSAAETHIGSDAQIRIHSNDAVHTQNGATAALQAEDATAPIREYQIGPPTQQNKIEGSLGTTKQYVGSRDNWNTVPQHEPWDRSGSTGYGTRTSYGAPVTSELVGEGPQPGAPYVNKGTNIGQNSPFRTTVPILDRNVLFIIVHCSANKPNSYLGSGIEAVDRVHKNRGWSGVGYNVVIDADGGAREGVKIGQKGAHTLGFNSKSVGVCLIGGLHATATYRHGRQLRPVPYPDYNDSQLAQLRETLTYLRTLYPKAVIRGHKDFVRGSSRDKACPCFNVPHWWKTGEVVADVGGLWRHVPVADRKSTIKHV